MCSVGYRSWLLDMVLLRSKSGARTIVFKEKAVIIASGGDVGVVALR